MNDITLLLAYVFIFVASWSRWGTLRAIQLCLAVIGVQLLVLYTLAEYGVTP